MSKQYTIAPNQSNKVLCKIINSYLSCENKYEIWNYDAQYLGCNEKEDITQCRSVILSHPQKQLLSFSYPKKEAEFSPLMKYANEFVEGCLVHLFYDHRCRYWEIATKNGIGGHYPVVKSPFPTKKYNFYIRTIFCDLSNSKQLNQIPWIQRLSKEHCYNFILQHPNICYMQSKKLYLIGVYELNRTTNSAMIIPHEEIQRWNCFPKDIIHFPQNILYLPLAIQEENDLLRICNDHKIDGIVCHDYNNGKHYIYKTHGLKEKQRIKHLHHKFLYQYLALKWCKHDSFYIQHYPYHKKMMSFFNVLIESSINEIYRYYRMYYIDRKIEKLPEKYKYYLEEIHQLYFINNLRRQKIKRVRIPEIKHYFYNKLSHSQQFYLLLYEKRKACVK